MLCVNCKEEAVIFFSKKYPCECGSSIEVSYVACEECNLVWETVNNKLFGEPEQLDPTYEAGADIAELVMNDLDNLLKAAFIEDNSMQDCVHRCLKCNSIAYESSDNTYSCSSCSFSWEVDHLL